MMSAVRIFGVAVLAVVLAACQSVDTKLPAVELPQATVESVPGIDR
jgi:hypothetical protein